MADGIAVDSPRGTSTPHDAVFKQFLMHPETAQDFMELHLPVSLQTMCDYSTLKLECGNFVEETLRPYFSDVLYSLKVADQDAYIYVLIEHQSSPDQYMAFRLLRYGIAAMQRHLDAGHKKLPLVVPVLFYAGKRSPYPYTTSLLDVFYDPKQAEYFYKSQFVLVDVTVIPDDEIVHHRRMAALTLIQKHIFQRDLSPLFKQLNKILTVEAITRQQLVSLINYLLKTGEAFDAKTFVVELAHKLPKHEDDLMTIAEQLEEIGRKRGLEEGRLEGRLEMKSERTLELAEKMLANHIDRDVVLRITGLSESELAQVCH